MCVVYAISYLCVYFHKLPSFCIWLLAPSFIYFYILIQMTRGVHRHACNHIMFDTGFSLHNLSEYNYQNITNKNKIKFKNAFYYT